MTVQAKKSYRLSSAGESFFRSAWRNRPLIWTLALRELTVRYKGSVLGFLWTFANPVLMMVVYTVIFSSMFKRSVDNYHLHVFAGILLWNVINAIMNESAGCMNANASLITKAAIPPEVITTRVVLTQLLNYCLSLPLFFIFSISSGLIPNIYALQVIFIFALTLIFIYPLAMCFSIIGAIYRDVQFLIGTLSFALFFTVPAMYTMDSLSEKMQKIFSLSPLTLLVKMNTDALFYQVPISLGAVAYILVWSAFLFVFASWLLKKFRSQIAEII